MFCRITRLLSASVVLVSGVACGGAEGTVTTPVVTTVAVGGVIVLPATQALVVGGSAQLTVATLSASGAVLTGRGVTWSSSDATRASVNTLGTVTGVGEGTATISATSEGKTGSAVITVASGRTTSATAIGNPDTFVAKCPTSDTAYATIRADFELRVNGTLSTVGASCTDPYTTVSSTQMTDELLAIQTFRVAYYMNAGTSGKLPWTPLGLYTWMKSEVAGINFNTNAANSSCCSIINGRKYINISRKTASELSTYRTFMGMANWLTLIAHEARHASGPGHVTGCAPFPNPTDAAGCDATYSLASLGSYGVQYWLFSALATGALNVGIGCLPAATAQSYATTFAQTATSYLPRFVTNPPSAVTATTPYGGTCIAP